MLLSSYMYRLFNNTYVPICIYIPTKYLPPYLISTYLLPTYLLTYVLHPRFSSGSIKSQCYQILIHIRFDKAGKVEDINSQKDNDLDLDLVENMKP
jgi:hypothetical protein